MSPLNSTKRPRRDDDDDSKEPLEGSSSSSSSNTKTPQELQAITWKLCEPAPVNIDGDGSITATGNTVYVNPALSSTLYVFNAVKGEWVGSIECDRKSFGLAVINGDLTLVGGYLEGSGLKTLTSLKSGAKWSQVYPPMNTCEGRVTVCGNGEHLLVANRQGRFSVSMEVMDVKTKKWKDVKNTPNVGGILSMTLLGDRVCVLGKLKDDTSFTSYCRVSTCSLSALLESPQFSVVEPLVWHKVCPISDLYYPFVANLGGNVVAIGGKKNITEYAKYNRPSKKVCSCLPVLHVYNVDSKDWNFVSHLPTRTGYPNVDFLVAPLQGDRLIVCGGNYYEQSCDGLSMTDIVYMGFFK